MKTLCCLGILLALHVVGLETVFWALDELDASLKAAYARAEPQLRATRARRELERAATRRSP